jgi:hypothetical protein
MKSNKILNSFEPIFSQLSLYSRFFLPRKTAGIDLRVNGFCWCNTNAESVSKNESDFLSFFHHHFGIFRADARNKPQSFAFLHPVLRFNRGWNGT